LAVVIAGAACGGRDSPGSGSSGATQPTLEWRTFAERVESAPISLTASDGSGLLLSSLTARAVIEEPLAFTELHLTFQNPEARQREGRFAITLPRAAAISRFAMRVNGVWQEGEVVERRRAQAVYEDYLHRKQDPALLEQDAGNQFTARVFPIGPNEAKEIIVSYSEELPRSSEPYRILLKGLSRLGALNVDIQFGSHSASGRESSDRVDGPAQRLTLSERDHVPSADLAVELPGGRGQPALRSGELVVARVSPAPELGAEPIDGLTVLFDTSASRALGFEAQIERLDALLRTLRERGADFPLRVLAFDQTVEEIYAGDASGFSARDKARLLARDALGASNLSAALTALSQSGSQHGRVLVVSDGVLTAGPEDTTTLREAVARLAAHGVRRLDALAEGGIRDESVLTALTRAGLKSTGVVLDVRLSVATLADKLLKATRDRVQVEVAGASWVHPRVLEGVQAGDEHVIFAQLDAGAPLRIDVGGVEMKSSVREAPHPLLERAHARARIEALQSELGAQRGDEQASARLSREIVALSIEHRVLSELTALLVLESVHEYARFGLDPRSLADILRIHEGGLELYDRGPANAAQKQVAVEGFAEGASRDDVPPPTALPAAAPIDQERSQEIAGLPERTSRGPGSAGEAPKTRSRAAPSRSASSPSPSAEPAPPAPAKQEVAVASPRSEAKGDLGSLGTAGVAPGGGGRVAASRGGAAEADTLSAQPEEARRPGAVLAVPVQLEPRALAVLHSASGLDAALAARVVRGKLAAAAKSCYARASVRADSPERVNLEFDLSERGTVRGVYVARGALRDNRAQGCIVAAAQALQFPKPDGGNASVAAGIELSMAPAAARPVAAAAPRPPRAAPKIAHPAIGDAYEGVLAATLEAIQRRDLQGARALAEAARREQPGDVIGLVALGEALEAQGEHARAARAYGSLIDLFPSRTDLRRMAAARLERLPREHGLALAADSYARALAQRPDHPSSHRLLAYAQLKQGAHAAAFATLSAALAQGFRPDRFQGVDRILREDLGLVAAAWLRAEPDQAEHVSSELARVGAEPARTPSLRFVLSWETDANDVDFHIYDGRGGHAYYLQRKLGSGGELYADITSGYGPECFAIPGKARAYPYTLQAHYFSRGPMGYGMGKLEVVDHDGQGNLRFSEHPFAIMKDKAFVELAVLEQPKVARATAL
jgi:tetratricopeptide (TPR) repeat protein